MTLTMSNVLVHGLGTCFMAACGACDCDGATATHAAGSERNQNSPSFQWLGVCESGANEALARGFKIYDLRPLLAEMAGQSRLF